MLCNNVYSVPRWKGKEGSLFLLGYNNPRSVHSVAARYLPINTRYFGYCSAGTHTSIFKSFANSYAGPCKINKIDWRCSSRARDSSKRNKHNIDGGEGGGVEAENGVRAARKQNYNVAGVFHGNILSPFLCCSLFYFVAYPGCCFFIRPRGPLRFDQ